MPVCRGSSGAENRCLAVVAIAADGCGFLPRDVPAWLGLKNFVFRLPLHPPFTIFAIPRRKGMEQKTITISDARLREAAAQGPGEFLQVFVDSYREAIGGELNTGNMGMLNGEQITLLAYALFREEVMEGGFIQLIHNGYGPFVFDNPFAKAVRLMGARDFSKLVNKGKRLYVKHKEVLTKDCSEEEFMALFEAYPRFGGLDDEFVEMEEEVSAALARYVDEHLGLFAEVVKG